MIVLISDSNMIEAGASSVVQFFCFSNKLIAYMNGLDKIDAGIQRH